MRIENQQTNNKIPSLGAPRRINENNIIDESIRDIIDRVVNTASFLACASSPREVSGLSLHSGVKKKGHKENKDMVLSRSRLITC